MSLKKCTKIIKYYKWEGKSVNTIKDGKIDEDENYTIKLFKEIDENITINIRLNDQDILLNSHDYCPKCGKKILEHGAYEYNDGYCLILCLGDYLLFFFFFLSEVSVINS